MKQVEEKGRCGVRLVYIAGMAFFLAFLRQTLLLGLLTGAAILYEKDEWLSLQCIQALLVSFITSIVSIVLGVFDVLERIPLLGNVIGWVFSLCSGLIGLVVLIVVIMGLINVLHGKDANLPWVGGVAARALGCVPSAPAAPSVPPAPAAPGSGVGPKSE